MIEKKTVVDQIEITRDGFVQIRFGLLLIEDGEEIDSKWHRTAIEPGGDIDQQFALVNTHLAQMGKAPVDAADIERVKSFAQLAHTEDVVKKHRARKDALGPTEHLLGAAHRTEPADRHPPDGLRSKGPIA